MFGTKYHWRVVQLYQWVLLNCCGILFLLDINQPVFASLLYQNIYPIVTKYLTEEAAGCFVKVLVICGAK